MLPNFRALAARLSSSKIRPIIISRRSELRVSMRSETAATALQAR